MLATAHQDFTLGYFKRALTGAEAVVRSKVRPLQRASALLLAADSAFALRDYARAAAHYTAFLSGYRATVDGPRAAMALGWARLREGDARSAYWTWSYVADEFPQDARAPLALLLAAGAAGKMGDHGSAQAALDRVIATYPRSAYVATARLQRSLVALERGDENAAARELADVIRTSGTAALRDQAAIASALTTPGAERALESAAVRPPGRGDSLERFVAAINDTRAPQTSAQGAALVASVNEPRQPQTVAAPRESQTTAPLLHGVALVAANERGWTDPLVHELANRLVDEFPSYRAAPALLTRVAGAAASAGRSQMAVRDYEKVVARYGDAPVGARARLELAEAFVQARALPQAREQLRRVALAGGNESPRAWLRLAEISQMMGDRREALAAYQHVPHTVQRTPESLLSQARLLMHAGQPDSARPLLETAAQTAKGATASEAAYELGRLNAERGQHAAALRWFTNASNAAPDSRWGRLAQLGAGDALAAMDRKQDALAAYTKLLAAAPVDAWRHSAAHAAERDAAGEAAYRSGKLLSAAGRHGEAVNMFMMSALFAKGSPAEGRALAGAVQCFIATGDHASAEAYYRQLEASGADESVLAEARRALNTGAGHSALPRRAR
jgi:tetratricopeptide (TPR) repeat protein